MMKSFLNISALLLALTHVNSFAQDTRVEKFVNAICAKEQKIKYTPCIFNSGPTNEEDISVTDFGKSGIEIISKLSNHTLTDKNTFSSIADACDKASANNTPMIALSTLGDIVERDCFCTFKSKVRYKALCDEFDTTDIGLIAKIPTYLKVSEMIIDAKIRHDKLSKETEFCPELNEIKGQGLEEFGVDLARVDLSYFPHAMKPKEYDPKLSFVENVAKRADDLKAKEQLKNNENLIHYLYKSEHSIEPNRLTLRELSTPDSRRMISAKKLYPKTLERLSKTNYIEKIKEAGSIEDYIAPFFSDKEKARKYLQTLGQFSLEEEIPQEVRDFEASLFLNNDLKHLVQSSSDINYNKPYDLIELIEESIKADISLLDYDKKNYEHQFVCGDIKRSLQKLIGLTGQKNGNLINEAKTSISQNISEFNKFIKKADGKRFIDGRIKSQIRTTACLDETSNILQRRSNKFAKLGGKLPKKSLETSVVQISVFSTPELVLTSPETEEKTVVPEVVEVKANEAVIESFESSANNFKEKVSKISDSPRKNSLIKEFNDYANKVYSSVTNRSYPGGFDIQRTPIKSYSKLMSDYNKDSFKIKASSKATDIIKKSYELKEELKKADPKRKREIQRLLSTLDEQLSSIENEGVDIAAIKREVASAFAKTQTSSIEVADKGDTPKPTQYKTKESANNYDRGVQAPTNATTSTQAQAQLTAATTGASSPSSDAAPAQSAPKANTTKQTQPVIKPIFLTAKQNLKEVLSSQDSRDADFFIIYDAKTDKIVKQSDSNILWSYEVNQIEGNMKTLDSQERKYVLELLEKRNRFKTENLNSILSGKR
ncbi:hypothetical protein [Halobacteriovorax sp. HLS]|uniref:hypothetical protein n=1 Tax=Halobacteriovorax sp. HLS TaxID=2234000 RepID=UPI000FD9C782|nr:hypothetical protein [Halobacteriovorax sp. HLS]